MEIINQIPTSWQTFRFKDYLKTLDVELSNSENDIFNGVDNTLKIISRITDVSVEVLEEMPYPEIMKMADRLKFMAELPDTKNTNIKWKDIETASYNDFITFLQYAENPIPHLPIILKTFSVNPMTEEDVLNMNVEEVYAGFFLLKKQVLKFLQLLMKKTAKQMVKQGLKETAQHLKQKLILKKRN